MLWDLIFKEITKTPDDIISLYKKRNITWEVTRIAPSPTWFFHIGTLYTAILNEIIARKTNWIFFLRAEDTDQKREVKWAMEKYVNVLKKFGILIDEWPIWVNWKDIWEYWPYTQSKREFIYKVFLKDLLNKGLAYPCFLTEKEIEDIKNIQEASKVPTWIYHEFSYWRNAWIDEVKKALEEKKDFVIRFKCKKDITSKVIVKDIVKNEVQMTDNFLDIVIMKKDWLPTYHFAHVVDDYLMWTTLVIRWDEWLASLPLHLQLFEALWFMPPKYAHIAPIVKFDNWNKRKLSKRKDTEANIDYYFENWYLVDSIIDYLRNLINSWFEDWRAKNPDLDYHNFDFKLEKTSSSWALLDVDKLNWVSSQVIKNKNIDDLYILLSDYLKEYKNDFYETKFLKFNENYNKNILKQLQLKLKKFWDFIDETTYFYNDFEIGKEILNLLLNKKMKIDSIDIAKKWLEIALDILQNKKTDYQSIDEVKEDFISQIQKNDMKNGQVLWPVRLALSGKEFSVWRFELIFILWISKSSERIKRVLNLI